MSGVKGRSGTGKHKYRPWTEALELAVKEIGKDGQKKLRAIAQKCIEMAMEGDVSAIREIGDRLDGKAPIGVELTGINGGPIEHVNVDQVVADIFGSEAPARPGDGSGVVH